MNLSACPIATVEAPVEQVWSLLADPSRYDQWWEARTVSIVPEGPARAGQRVVARAGALGITAAVVLTVQRIQPETHQLEIVSQLPFGFTGHNVITCTPLDERQTRVSLG